LNQLWLRPGAYSVHELATLLMTLAGGFLWTRMRLEGRTGK